MTVGLAVVGGAAVANGLAAPFSSSTSPKSAILPPPLPAPAPAPQEPAEHWAVELMLREGMSKEFAERHRRSRFFGVSTKDMALSNAAGRTETEASSGAGGGVRGEVGVVDGTTTGGLPLPSWSSAAGVTVEAVDERLPRCLLLRNVLTPEECEAFIRVTEDVGYEQITTGRLNNNAWLTLIVDAEKVERPLFDRCRAALPSVIGAVEAGAASERNLAGLNQREFPDVLFLIFLQNA